MKRFFTPFEFVKLVSDLYDSLIFDLDNTIFDENEFLFDRYRVIANLLAGNNEDLARKAFEFLRCKFLNCGREQLFDAFLTEFDVSRSFTIDDLLARLREPLPTLKTFSYFKPLADQYKGSLYLVTNGNPQQQRNKLAALGIDDYFKEVVLANTIEKKPSALSLMPLIAKGKLGRCSYVGDSEVDRAFALNCCLPFYRLRFDRHQSGLVDQNSLFFEK